MSRHGRWLPLLIILFSLPFVASAADLSAQFSDRLAPIEGVVIMQVDDAYLIDKDATDGVHQGDYFAVIQKGAAVVHPVTGAVIGRLDEIRAYLQVSKVRSGYSYAIALNSNQTIEKGASIRRYDGITARFVDLRGDGRPLYQTLVKELSQFNWQAYQLSENGPVPGAGAEPEVIFRLGLAGLSVETGEGLLLTQADPVALGLPQTGRVPVPPVYTANAGPRVNVAPQSESVLIQSQQNGQGSTLVGGVIVQDRPRSGLWRSPALSGEAVALAGGDFDGDGNQELALLTTDTLEISRLKDGQFQQLASIKLPNDGQSIALDAMDLDGDQRAELYVSRGESKEANSLLVEFRDGHYIIAEKKIHWYLRALRQPDGSMQLAGRQSGQGGNLTAGPVYKMSRQRDSLATGDVLPVPDFTGLFSFQPFLNDSGERLLASITLNDHLQISDSTGEPVWQGLQLVGGHRASVGRAEPDDFRGSFTQKIFRQARVGLGPQNELLVPVNEGSRFLSQQHDYNRSHLAAFKWDGFAMQEQWRTPDENAYLADFTVIDADNDGKQELLAAFVSGRGWLSGKEKTVLVVYELP